MMLPGPWAGFTMYSFHRSARVHALGQNKYKYPFSWFSFVKLTASGPLFFYILIFIEGVKATFEHIYFLKRWTRKRDNLAYGTPWYPHGIEWFQFHNCWHLKIWNLSCFMGKGGGVYVILAGCLLDIGFPKIDLPHTGHGNMETRQIPQKSTQCGPNWDLVEEMWFQHHQNSTHGPPGDHMENWVSVQKFQKDTTWVSCG